MRRWLLPLVLLAAPALAEAPALYLVAPAGECAGEERDLVLRPLPSPRDDEAPPRASLLHLAPTNVAASAPAPRGVAPPLSAAAFSGPEPCDNPGSGCAVEKLLDDPDPGTGCGFPGSGCP